MKGKKKKEIKIGDGEGGRAENEGVGRRRKRKKTQHHSLGLNRAGRAGRHFCCQAGYECDLTESLHFLISQMKRLTQKRMRLVCS